MPTILKKKDSFCFQWKYKNGDVVVEVHGQIKFDFTIVFLANKYFKTRSHINIFKRIINSILLMYIYNIYILNNTNKNYWKIEQSIKETKKQK